MGRNRRKIGLEQRSDMGRFADRSHHIFGDLESHPVERNILRCELAQLRRRRFANADHGHRSNRPINIITGDAAVPARSLDSTRIDVVLEQRPADGGA